MTNTLDMTVQSQDKLTNSVKSESPQSKTMLGFWIYLMTDLIIFGTLFATFIVLRGYPHGGSSNFGLFSMPFVLVETLLLLTSSFTAGLSMLMVHQGRKQASLVWLGITFLLGAGFLGMELHEFSSLAAEGNSWRTSGFLSGFYTLVGTHGFHIFVGLTWMIVMGWQVLKLGFTKRIVRQLSLLNLFWHFLDIVWIFIFTIVYLLGAI